jgi:hypothetical protein
LNFQVTGKWMCIVSVLLAVGCRESTAQIRRPTPVHPKRVSFVTGASDTIALSYVCGNHFRVTHTGAVTSDSLMVHWRTTVGDTGSVRLYRKLYGRTFTESIFETPTADSVRISGFGGRLIEANAGSAVCTPSRDTTWITARDLGVALATIDTTGGLLIDATYKDTLWSRPLTLAVRKAVSRDSLARVLAPFGIRVVGALPGRLTRVRLDVVRPTASGLLALVDSLSARPEIAAVMVVSRRSGRTQVKVDGKFPVDSGRLPRGSRTLRTAQEERPPTNP